MDLMTPQGASSHTRCQDQAATPSGTVSECPPVPDDQGPALLDQAQACLLCRARGEDPGPALNLAFNRFHDAYGPLLLSVARNHAAEGQEAQDGCQDVWMLLLRRLPRFTYDPSLGSFDHWLVKVARRKLRRLWRQSKRRRVQTLDPAAAAELASPEIDPALACEPIDAAAIIRALFDLVRLVVDSTSLEVVQLHAIEGLRISEVATRVGLTIEGTKSRYRRAINALREIAAGSPRRS